MSPARALAGVDFVVGMSPYWASSDEAIKSLLRNRGRIAWVRAAAHHFSHLLSSIIYKSDVFPEIGSPTFLVDFDVLFEYLSVKGNVSPRSLAVEAFFQSSEFSFAIPLGSFLELLNWLNQAHFQLLPEERSYTPEQTVQLLGRRLSVHYKSESDTEAAQQAVRESLDDDIVQVQKLLDLLQSPRFTGVEGAFIEGDKATVLPYVRTIFRHDERPELRLPISVKKERRDQNDALNLAITCYAVRSDRLQKALLLTNTRPLADLPNYFGTEWPTEANDFQTDMDMLLGSKGEPVAQHYPVVSPFDVWVWQLMRKYARSNNQNAGLIEARDGFHELAAALDWMMIRAEDEQKRAEQETRVRAALLNVSKQAVDPSSPIGPFMKFTLSEAAIRQGRRLFALQQREADGSKDQSEQYLTLARLLLQVGALVEPESQRLIGYDKWAMPTGSLSNTGVSFLLYFGGSRAHSITIAEGEVYMRKPSRRLLVIRWPVICRLYTFLKAVRMLLRLRKVAARHTLTNPVSKFVRVKAGSGLSQSGVVAYTSFGTWGTNLDFVFNSKMWGQVLRQFKMGAIYSLVDDPRLDFISKTGEQPEMLSLRVNSEIGDFVFDVVPTDRAYSQYVTYLAHEPKVDDVLKLMVNTSSSVVLEPGLSSTMGKLFQDVLQPDNL